ncbi:apolipoprotein N-acyltransferase [Allocatelliglobosispora scoriae]|uniref:apolipoprotein N-acyltransferase n=1 Tax=Allocatelliglobosispora scoriae TaxID=643052 RepID=UPI0035E40BF6
MPELNAPAVPAPRPLPFLVGLALAAASGLAMLLAFPSYDLWWLAPVAVALLALACHRRRLRTGALFGLISGVVFFAPLLSWTNTHVGNAPWILLVGLQAVYFALLGAALAWVSVVADRWRWSWPVLVGLLWVGQEAMRGRTPFGGFPWGRVAFSQGSSPVLSLAAVGGAPLVTFVVCLSGGLLAGSLWSLSGWLRIGRGRAVEPPLSTSSPFRGGSTARPLLLAGLGVVAAVGLVLAPGVLRTSGPGGPGVVVAVVQGNVPRMGLDFNAQRAAVLENHVRATLELAADVKAGTVHRPDFVVWPENSSDIDPLRNADAGGRIQAAADAVGVPILVGAVLSGPGEGHARNAGIVWLPGTGAGETYVKRHPVPFAEYLPLRPLVEPIAKAITDKAGLLRTDFLPGETDGVLTMGPARVGDIICFEVAYDGLVKETVDAGAQLLAVQTNNATFDVDEARQQLAMVRLRAVEHNRDSLMASTVGVSALVTGDGVVHRATDFFTPAVIVGELHPSTARTLATRLGAAPETVMAALALAALVLAGIVRRSARRAAQHGN